MKDQNKIEETTSALLELCSKTIEESGCTVFTLHQDQSEPMRFLLWERFDDEMAFKQHFEEEHTKKYVELGLIEIVQVSKTGAVNK
ncbi:putative quinol monooxygenase [Spartinivicinus ruber]|uniref:putative quinol monooxygenase n=1 Tax=Spartinivicinus ruber TaxID=2683272 RepID=UPI001CA3BBFE|nr:antibiotic biosynthesis monooxygenase [Spartinivicinus ruber]